MILIFNNYRNRNHSQMKNNRSRYRAQQNSHGFDCGPEPFIANIDDITVENNNYRTTVWTGDHMQLTLMSIIPGGDIGLEVHPDVDQFFRVEEGEGLVMVGSRQDRLEYQARIEDDFAFIVPAGKWHNVINTGDIPLKLYSIYAPPQHPPGTIHKTKEEAEEAEGH